MSDGCRIRIRRWQFHIPQANVCLYLSCITCKSFTFEKKQSPDYIYTIYRNGLFLSGLVYLASPDLQTFKDKILCENLWCIFWAVNFLCANPLPNLHYATWFVIAWYCIDKICRGSFFPLWVFKIFPSLISAGAPSFMPADSSYIFCITEAPSFNEFWCD